MTFAEVCPSIRDSANTFTPELIAIDAQLCLKSCGVIFCTLARFTAPANHPPTDFGRGRYVPSPNTRSSRLAALAPHREFVEHELRDG